VFLYRKKAIIRKGGKMGTGYFFALKSCPFFPAFMPTFMPTLSTLARNI